MTLFFPTNIHADSLLEASSFPPTFREQYSVTGHIRKVRNRRALPLCVRVIVNATSILLFKLHNQVLATESTCPHQGASIEYGDIEDAGPDAAKLTCPVHHYTFSLTTGNALNLPGCPRRLVVYPTRIDDQGCVEVGFEKLATESFAEPDF